MTAARGALGTVSREGDGTHTVRFERRLDHAPERVWAALTDPEEARHWFVELTLEPRIGGRVHLDFGEEGEATGEVLTWEPPRLLEHSWHEAGVTSHVRWELQPEDAGTRLLLVHTGLGANPHEYGAGWHDFIERLPVYLDGGEPDSSGEGFEQLLEEYRAHFDASG